MVQLSHLYMTSEKNHTFDYTYHHQQKWCLCFFNMLPRFVIAFFPRSKHLLISWLQSPSTVILEPKKYSLSLFSFSPIYLPWWDQMPWSSFFEFWVLGQLFLFSFTLIKRLFSFTSISAITVVSFAYLRLLIVLPAILIPACDLSCLACHMMFSA